FYFFFSSRRRHTRWPRDWSSDVCSSDLRSCRRVSLRMTIDSGAMHTSPLTRLPLTAAATRPFLQSYGSIIAVNHHRRNDSNLSRSEERRVGKEYISLLLGEH